VITGSCTGDLIDTAAAIDLLERHRTGGADLSRRIWAVVVFCLWHALVVEGKAPAAWTRPAHEVAA
jgi:asparagine synthase (glutamine-hydrolysing)